MFRLVLFACASVRLRACSACGVNVSVRLREGGQHTGTSQEFMDTEDACAVGGATNFRELRPALPSRRAHARGRRHGVCFAGGKILMTLCCARVCFCCILFNVLCFVAFSYLVPRS